MSAVIQTRFKVAAHNAADWTAGNPILLDRELALERDTGKLKFGDGATAWNSLPYSVGPTYTAEDAQDAVGGILVDSATINFTYTDATPEITAIVIDDSVSNAKLANMAQATIKGRQAAAGTGDPEDLTASQARTAIGLGTAATQATGTSGATLPFLNGTNTWGALQTIHSVSIGVSTGKLWSYSDATFSGLSSGSGFSNDGILFTAAGGQTRIQVSNAYRLRITTTATTPYDDNTNSLGTGSERWTTVYAATGTINTSDAREKTAIAPLAERELAASVAMAREIGTFRFLAAVKEKGDAARLHVGLTVQRAMEIMKAQGLDPFAYAFICHDRWDDSFEEVRGKHGPTKRLRRLQKAGDRYGFRTDELLLFIARGFDARLSALELESKGRT